VEKHIVETHRPKNSRRHRGRPRLPGMAARPAARHDVATSGGPPHALHSDARQTPVMSFTSTVARALVHKQAADEVLLTDSARDEDLFWVAAKFPSSHGLYGDRADRTRHDFIALLEMVRQAGYLVPHRYLGVPLDYRFVLRDIDLHLADGFSAMPRKDAGSDVVMAVAATDRVYRNDVLSRWRSNVTVGMDGEVVADGVLTGMAMPDPAYQRLRSLGRRDLPAGPELGRPPSERWSPLHVGRGADSNVVITPLRDLGEGRVRAELVVDSGHPTFFDHELDHVPGMLLMEAAGQTAIAGTASCHGIDPRELHLVAVSSTFESFAELDLPLTCDATIGPLAGRSPGASVEAKVQLHHAGRSVGAIATHVAAQPIAERTAHAWPPGEKPESVSM
jgi:hypothetical protein